MAGTQAQKAIYVGDSEVDAETATRAKLPFVLFTEGYRKAPISDLPHQESLADYGKISDIIAGIFRAMP